VEGGVGAGGNEGKVIMAVILCYGDSNTHGASPLERLGLQGRRHALDERWPNVMAGMLGPGHRVIDEGLGGRTTVHDDPVEGGMRNGMTVLPAVLHSHKPIDLVVLMLGTNDLKQRFSVSAFEIARSVERLVLTTRAEAVAKDILIVAPVPVRECGSLAGVYAGAEARQAGLTSYLAEMAERQGCGFFDAGSVIEVSPLDGVHFGVDAHATLGQALAQAVLDRLR
jgi:lysophospholipase L1-like esterase